MYHLFAWEDWKADGGMSEYAGAFDNIAAAKAWFNSEEWLHLDHAQIVTVGINGRLELVAECDRSQFFNQRVLAPWKDYK